MSAWEAHFSSEDDPHSWTRVTRPFPPPPQEMPPSPSMAAKAEWRPDSIPTPSDPTDFFMFQCPPYRLVRPVWEGNFINVDGAKSDKIPVPYQVVEHEFDALYGGGAYWSSARPPTRLPDVEALLRNHIYLVSERFLQTVLAFDAGAVVHRPLGFRFKDGSKPSVTMHVMGIRRRIWGVDIDRSAFRFSARSEDGRKFDWFIRDAGPICTRNDLPKECHLFLQIQHIEQHDSLEYCLARDVFISKPLRDALRPKNTPKLTGWQWRHPACAGGILG